MKDARPRSEDHQQTKFSAARRSSNISPTTAVPSSIGTPSLISSRIPHVTTIISSSDVSSTGGNRTKSAATTAIVSGMATSPSIYDYRSPRYQNVLMTMTRMIMTKKKAIVKVINHTRAEIVQKVVKINQNV